MSSAQKGSVLSPPKGFTLVELLIVIMIIAILAVGGLGGYMLQIKKGHDTTRKKDLRALKTAFENYEADNGCYPDTSLIGTCGGTDLQPYLETVPCDPYTKTRYKLVLNPSTGCAAKFYLFATLASPGDPQKICTVSGTSYLGIASSNAPPEELTGVCANL